MGFSEKLKEIINQGLDISKDIIDKASAEAKKLGAQGVHKMEILNLQAQARKLSAQLGVAVYEELMEKGQASVGADSPAIKDIIQKLDLVNDEIDAREADFKAEGGKAEDLKTS